MPLDKLLKNKEDFDKIVDMMHKRLPKENSYLFVHDNQDENAMILEAKRSSYGYRKASLGKGGPSVYLKKGDREDLEKELLAFDEGYFASIISPVDSSSDNSANLDILGSAKDTVCIKKKDIEAHMKRKNKEEGLAFRLKNRGLEVIEGYAKKIALNNDDSLYLILSCNLEDPSKKYSSSIPSGNAKDITFNIFDSRYSGFNDNEKEARKKAESLMQEGYVSVIFLKDKDGIKIIE